MNNITTKYFKEGKTDLGAAALDLLHKGGTNTQGSPLIRQMNFIDACYRRYLLTGKGLTNLKRQIKPILKGTHPTIIWMLLQRMYGIRGFLHDNELYEVLQHFWQINNKLADYIVTLRPDIDVSGLRSEEEFDAATKEMHWEIARFLFNNNLTHLI